MGNTESTKRTEEELRSRSTRSTRRFKGDDPPEMAVERRTFVGRGDDPHEVEVERGTIVGQGDDPWEMAVERRTIGGQGDVASPVGAPDGDGNHGVRRAHGGRGEM